MNKQRETLTWRQLDNSAKIFPVSAGKRYSTVFRISAVLKEDVKKEILEQALKKALEKFPSFRVRMKQGFFWNYFEYNTKEPIVEEETDYPCKYIDPKTNENYLFKVTYFKNKINIDIYHALTDGNNGNDFFKEIVYNYIEIAYKEEFKEDIRTARKYNYNEEDSYIKNYDKNAKNNNSSKKAYVLKGDKLTLGAVGVIHEIINLEQLKTICKEKQVTTTQYLTAVLIWSMYQEQYKKYNGKKPIKVCIPVNLKKYFPSNTISNFFSYITLELEKENMKDFDTILTFVKDDFEKRLTFEELEKTMSGNVKLGQNPIVKIIPLPLKKIFVRLAYLEIRKYTTITFSNIGRIGMIGKYKEYIEEFLFLIAPEPVETIKCSSCTFENKLVFTFTTILEDTAIEKRFYEILIENGIDVKIESNGVLDVISE